MLVRQIESLERLGWKWGLVALAVPAVAGWLLVVQGRGTIGDRSVADSAAGEPAALDATRGDTVAGAPAAVNAYLRFVADPEASTRAGISHDYTAEGLRRLADALAAVAAERQPADSAITAHIASVRRHADALQQTRRWSEHARDAREAFLLTTDVLALLEGRTTAGVARDVMAARQAARHMDVELDPIAQLDRIERSFAANAAVLRRLAGRGAAPVRAAGS
jgi:hypothetical protein